MKIYLIAGIFIIAIVVSLCLYYHHKVVKEIIKITNSKIGKSPRSSINLFFALLPVIVCLAIGFIFLWDLSNGANFDQNTGFIGDTIGGILNPFIAIAGVVVTGLAFYMQYQANEQQKEFFYQEQTTNKFESQFYEMLRLHRENISEMKISGYDFRENSIKGKFLDKFDKQTESRKVFVTMQTEFECILYLYKDNFGAIDDTGFEKCYSLFFSGLDDYKKKYYADEQNYIDFLYVLRDRHEYPEETVQSNFQRKSLGKGIALNFNYKPFSGHSSRLGHYFRHIFLTVKFITNSEIVFEYEEKMRYLRILRAQLSNHEQTLLFYNWISRYGDAWENEDNQFFTEFKMIHNLQYTSLLDDDYIKGKVDYLRNKKFRYRIGEMYEIDEVS